MTAIKLKYKRKTKQVLLLEKIFSFKQKFELVSEKFHLEKIMHHFLISTNFSKMQKDLKVTLDNLNKFLQEYLEKYENA